MTLRLATQTWMRRVPVAAARRGGTHLTTTMRAMSVVPRPDDDIGAEKVIIDRYYSSPPPASATQAAAQPEIRLPNNDRERSALYQAEEERSLGGYTAQVRHDWTKQEIADIYSLPFGPPRRIACTGIRPKSNSAPY